MHRRWLICVVLVLAAVGSLMYFLGGPRREYMAAERKGRWAVVSYDAGTAQAWTATSGAWTDVTKPGLVASHRRTGPKPATDRSGNVLGWGHRSAKTVVWTDENHHTFWGVVPGDCLSCVDEPVPLIAYTYDVVPDGSAVVATRLGGDVVWIDVASRTERLVVDTGVRDPLLSGISPDGRWIGLSLLEAHTAIDRALARPTPVWGDFVFTAVRAGDGALVPLVRADHHVPNGWVILGPE